MNYLLALITSWWLWLKALFVWWNDPLDEETGPKPSSIWQWAPDWLTPEGQVLWVWRSKSHAHWASLGIYSAEDVRNNVTIFS